ncbi:GNAT family N-acetyltransferase [Halorarius halobius]|uniref:GNAT family N-acetyltransferase n=1 Tax=Halorarius halobius TaxID=2962671 RepID=UPI0020CC4B67|nr:GNAT family N-acetyltransferase [Halorarius halobius]
MYQGHFPPLGRVGVVAPPPLGFFDGEERYVDLQAYGEGPVDDERDAVVEMYLTFDPQFRTLGVPPISAAAVREWQDVLLDGHCVLAWHGDRVVGQAVLVPDGDGDHEFAIFLHQEYHGAGIGTRLTEATLSYGHERGVDRVWLLVERDNRPAVALYRDVGFAVTSTVGAEMEMALTMDW